MHVQPLHMSAAALNILHNVLLRSEKRDESLSILVNNHPLPRNASEQVLCLCMSVLSVGNQCNYVLLT